MPLFAIFINIIFFDLYLKKKRMGFYTFRPYFFQHLYCFTVSPILSSGYVDFAAAFLSTAAFHAILTTDIDDSGQEEYNNGIPDWLLPQRLPSRQDL